ncbi:MAG: hypothetical protein QOH62_1983 [Solirubrobacteraceae bacterium]|nr:hypothetical protein [Solirubrobacteraceae bacterium]
MPDPLTDLAGLRVGAEVLLAAVLEAAQAIWVVDRSGVIRFASPAAVAALGYDSADELLGRRSYPMLAPQATGEKVASDLEWFVRRDGSRFPVSYVSVPIELPDGRGAVVAFTDIEDRVRAAQVVRERDAVLGAREDSLRRVATLVAGGAASGDVFAAIAREVGHVVGLPLVLVWRFDPGKTTATVIAAWSEDPHPWEAGTRWPVDGRALAVQMLETGRPARIDDYKEVPGRIAAASRKTRLRGSAGAPIIVDGDMWGWMAAATARAPLPDHIEDRLAEFTELVATAISGIESRDQLARLADEQAALRRVATLVAYGTRPEEVFAAVANEVERLLSVDLANVCRYESDGTLTFVASARELVPVGSRWPIEGQRNLATLVSEAGGPARIDNYADATGALAEGIREEGIRSAVGTPIIVEGRLWGLIAAGANQEQPLPPDTEERLSSFTALVATAIANTEARTEVGRLVDEQAALRRVATLVAEGAAPSEVFQTVTQEVGILCGADLARMERYETGDSVIGVAGWSRGDAPGLAVGKRFSLEGASIAALVREASGPVRVDSFAGAHGPIAQEARDLGIRSSVGGPIVANGRLWGVIAASSKSATPFPPGTESQIAEFTELVATAIVNAEARAEVAASRARIVAATDAERRRVVRDLHDGAQQRLVHTVVTLKLAHRALQHEDTELPALLTEALDNAEQATDELRELAHGILPTVLTQGGLRAGVDALASRMPVPVEIDVAVGRLPAAVEATAYFVVAEALTNVAKHARARRAEVTARIENGTLAVHVRDDGIGGARPSGSGLLGLADRLAVLDGKLRVESPVDAGTLVAAGIPVRE